MGKDNGQEDMGSILDIARLGFANQDEWYLFDNIDGSDYEKKTLKISEGTGDDSSYNYEKCKELYFQQIINLEKYKVFFDGGFIGNGLDKISFNFSKDSKTDGLELYFEEYFKGLNGLRVTGFGESFQTKIEKIDVKTMLLSEGGDSRIRNLHISCLSLDNFNNYSDNFVLQNLVIDRLIINNSDLGKMKFNGVTIHELYLKNVTMNDCVFNSVEFPKSYELGKNDEFDKRKTTINLSDKQMKDNYRQLKYIMDKNGNKTEANKFFEKEMESYMGSLEIKRPILSEIKSLFKVDFIGGDAKNVGEKIVLLFGRGISEFGNNWMRTMMLIFLVAFVANSLDLMTVLFDLQYQGYGDYIVFTMFLGIIGFTYFFPGLDEKLNKLVFTKTKSVLKFLIVSLVIFVIFSFFEKQLDFHAIKNLGNLLYPLSWTDASREYNGLEISMLLIYKFIYGILLWHLGVALKRTTKR